MAILNSPDSSYQSFPLRTIYAATISANNYTVTMSDRDKTIELNNTVASTLTVPPNSTTAFPIGSEINLLQTNTGVFTITPGSGVTINGTPGLKIRTQWSSATLIKRALNTWVLVGDLSA